MNHVALRGLLLFALVLPGCVGVGIVGSTRRERRLKDVFFREVQPIHTQVVLDRYGEPDRVEKAADGTEVWTYKSHVRWSGVVLCVVIPIPLVLPVGRESTSFTVRDGVVVSASQVVGTTTLYIAGLVPGVCPDFGIGVYHR